MRDKIKKNFNFSALKIGILITIISTSILIKHYISPNKNFDIIDQVENKIYDLRYLIRGENKPSGVVGALTADDKSIERFGHWPFRRDIYTKILQNLKNAGVKWVALDVLFSEPSRTTLEESIPKIKELFQKKKIIQLSNKNFDEEIDDLINNSGDDKNFGQAIEQFENVIQSYYFVENKSYVLNSDYSWLSSFQKLKNSSIDFINFPKNKSLLDYPDLTSYGVVTNTDKISGKNKYMGFANTQPDSDGMIRKYLLVKIINPIDKSGKQLDSPILVPSLGLATVQNYLNATSIIHFDTTGIDSIELTQNDFPNKTIKIPVYFDGRGQLLVNHYGSFSSFPQITLVDAYDNKLPEKLPAILIYAGIGTGTNDKKPNPFDESFEGAGFHIAVIENILNEHYMKRPLKAPFIEIFGIVFSGILFSYILKHASALRSALIIFGLLIGLYYFDKYFLFGRGNWFFVGIFYIQNICIYICITIYKYFTEENEKKMMKNAFQRYLNPNVIHKIIENPALLKLGGEKKVLTVFFSDIRGFTSISEKLSAEKLTSVLNEYFTPMTQIVLDSDGLLDKYIGDAMMAAWGTPITLKDHADRAVRSSLKMLDELKKLQEKWEEEGLPYLDIGIGLNTGEMVVGNIGSDQRFDFTVLGDAVNLGSRLESINKNYGTQIICSEFTKNSLIHPEEFLLRELDIIRVKGKIVPIKIFEVVSFSSSNRNLMNKLIQTFDQGILFYREQKWVQAIEIFQSILQEFPNDGPSKFFLERCQYLQANPVSQDWDGVWEFTSK